MYRVRRYRNKEYGFEYRAIMFNPNDIDNVVKCKEFTQGKLRRAKEGWFIYGKNAMGDYARTSVELGQYIAQIKTLDGPHRVFSSKHFEKDYELVK